MAYATRLTNPEQRKRFAAYIRRDEYINLYGADCEQRAEASACPFNASNQERKL